MGLRLLVCGGREFDDEDVVWGVLDMLHRNTGIDSLATGGCRGADRLAYRWAERFGIDRPVFEADWTRHGRSAGPKRNALMLETFKPDLVIAFPGGRGTADMVARAKAAGVDVAHACTEVIDGKED